MQTVKPQQDGTFRPTIPRLAMKLQYNNWKKKKKKNKKSRNQNGAGLSCWINFCFDCSSSPRQCFGYLWHYKVCDL